MTRFIIHVGPHKTGTTYLQEGFARFRTVLAGHGIHYPKIWGPVTHHRLLDDLSSSLPNPRLESEFKVLLEARHRVVLLSVEGLTGLREPNVAYFRKLLGDAEVQIVFYARSWADILPSHWKEEVKAGRLVATFPEYVCGQLLNPHLSGLVNFGDGLRLYARAFGTEAIRVVSYDQVLTEKIDLLQHFSSVFLGIADIAPQALPRQNVSHGTIEIEIIRALNALERRRRTEPTPVAYAIALRDGYLARSEHLRDSALVKTAERHIDQLQINEATRALLTIHQDLFAEFGKSLVAPQPARLFFEPRRVPVPYVRSDYMLGTGVAADLNSLHSELTAEIAGKGGHTAST